MNLLTKEMKATTSLIESYSQERHLQSSNGLSRVRANKAISIALHVNFNAQIIPFQVIYLLILFSSISDTFSQRCILHRITQIIFIHICFTLLERAFFFFCRFKIGSRSSMLTLRKESLSLLFSPRLVRRQNVVK